MFKAPPEHWKKVRYIPPSSTIPKKDKLKGGEQYGNPKKDKAPWGIKFDEVEFTKFKFEFAAKSGKPKTSDCKKEDLSF